MASPRFRLFEPVVAAATIYLSHKQAAHGFELAADRSAGSSKVMIRLGRV